MLCMEQFVTIKTFTYPHEAYVIRGKLESEGISVLFAILKILAIAKSPIGSH